MEVGVNHRVVFGEKASAFCSQFAQTASKYAVWSMGEFWRGTSQSLHSGLASNEWKNPLFFSLSPAIFHAL